MRNVRASRIGRRAARVVVASVVPALAATALLVAGPAPEAHAAVVLPAGFLLQDIDTGMVPPSASGPGDLLTDFAYLPDESFIATGKYGRVQWVPRVGAPRRIADLAVNSSGDLGLISVAIAPDYETTHAVYTARAVPSTAAGAGANGVLRLSRWTVAVDGAGDPTALTDEVTVLETSADAPIHSFGSVLPDRDGALLLTIGDGTANRIETQGLRALDIDDLHGKLLRINPDGSGVPDNPFYDPAHPRAARSLVFASGLRSPFRFSLDPGTGLPVLGDVGKNTTEEIDLIRPGYSFGWPCWEGSAPTVGYTDLAQCTGVTTTKPLWEYQHNGSGAAVTGGVVYTGTAYPAKYQGRYFFGDYVDQTLWTLGFAATGELTQPPESAGFGTGVGKPTRFATAPGGDVVFADIGAARVRRLVYTPGNAAPVAAFASSADPATLSVTFDAGASSDANGDLLTYSWDFGDGTTGTGVAPTHTYSAEPDHYDVTLTVADPFGASGTKTMTVYPGNHPPSLDVTWPDPDLTYAVGDVVHASAVATDQEDGPVVVTWSSRLEHCYSTTDCHQHYGATSTGPTLDLVVDGHEGDTQLWITASATDSRGASASEEFKVLPRQHRVTIESTWPAAFTIGDEHVSTGLFTEGLTLLLVAPELGFDGLSTFYAWGDGVTSRSRQVTVGTSDLTIEAVYRTPIDTRLATDSAFSTRMGSPTGVEQGDLSLRSRTFTGGVAHWSAATGVHFVAGAIGTRYAALGGPRWCGPPTTDEARTAARDGYYNHFAKGCSIFWSKAGTHWVNGRIRELWASLGWERSFLGYPVADIARTPTSTGYLTRFQGGTIYYGSAATGARYVRGATLTKYTAMKAEASVLKYPTTHTNPTRNKDGTYQHFQGGSIFWNAGAGAHPVTGALRSKYASLGWERSWLGYPTSDPFTVTIGRRQNFQHGYLVWNRTTGVVSAFRT